MVETKSAEPYHVLSLDGGGVRGYITINILADIETKLAEGRGGDDYSIA